MTRLRRSARDVAASFAAASGLNAWSNRRRHQRGDHRIFILEYHDVSAAHEREGVISSRRFRQHLRYLKRYYRLMPLADAVRLLARRAPLSEDYVVITFDDGHAGNYEHAWPVLREEQVSATIFVATGFLDGAELWFDRARRALDAIARRGVELPPVVATWPARRDAFMDQLKQLPPPRRDAIVQALADAGAPLDPPARPLRWEQVREMQAAGMTIGCHTVSHPILSTLPIEGQQAEIRRARERIADATGVVPDQFAYPNGAAADFTAATVELVRRAGFTAACTTARGSNGTECDLFTLRRIGVGAEPPLVLAARLAGLFDDAMRAWWPRPSTFRPAHSEGGAGQ